MTESTNEFVPGDGVLGPSRQGQRELMLWVREKIRLLPVRLGIQQAAKMPLGTRVLVLKGDSQDNLGQMAIVSLIARSQVVISYRGPTGLIKTRRKQQASLIPTGDDVELVMDD